MHFIRELSLLEMDLVTGGDRTVPPRKRAARPGPPPNPDDLAATQTATQAAEAAREAEGEPRLPPAPVERD